MTNKVLHAFPSPSAFTPDGDTLESGNHGMTLRDYFAGKAMVMALDYWRRVGCEEGCTPQPDYDFRWDPDRITLDCKEVAELSYVMADAMLCARKLPSNAI